jgi:hypothetical protein
VVITACLSYQFPVIRRTDLGSEHDAGYSAERRTRGIAESGSAQTFGDGACGLTTVSESLPFQPFRVTADACLIFYVR